MALLLAALLVPDASAGPQACVAAPIEHFIDDKTLPYPKFPQTTEALRTHLLSIITSSDRGKLGVKLDACCPTGQHATGLQANPFVPTPKSYIGQAGNVYRWDFKINAIYCGS